jgi:hypothetical protein
VPGTKGKTLISSVTTHVSEEPMILKSVCIVACIPVLVACSTPYSSPVFAAKSGGDVKFKGVADSMQPGRPLDVLFVHGMCTHDATWATEAVQQFVTSIGGDSSTVHLTQTAVAGTDVLLFQQTIDSAQGQVRANAVLWSPLTTPLKKQLCYDESDKSTICTAVAAYPEYPYQRAKLNKVLKDGILDDCLADALIYQGKARDQVSGQIQKAILQAVATSGGSGLQANVIESAAAVPQTTPLVVVTESLGSKIAFDALYKLAANPATASAGQNTFDRTTQIFMGANQLPILALADRGLDGSVEFTSSGGYPEDPISALIKRRLVGVVGAGAPIPQVIAFSDPNDLLSYTLAPSPQAASAAYPVVDVIVSNTKTYLGLVEMPTTAHTSYLTNPAVMQLIACGNPKSGTCH